MGALRTGPLRHLTQAAAGLGAVALASVVLAATDADQTVAALVLVMVGVLLTLVGRTAALVAIVASFASLNFFFMPPEGSFGVGKGDDLVALATLALTTGILATTITRANRLRTQADVRAREIRVRLDLANRLADGDDPARVVADAQAAMRTLFGLADARMQVGDDGALHVDLGTGAGGDGTDREDLAAYVLELRTALDRVRLADEVRAAQVATAVESGRAAFLSAMTHNLRTPLATIKAATSGLLHTEPLDDDAARELLEVAYQESDRLERLVTKVLALSRIRAGALEARREPVDIAEAIQIAVQRLAVLAVDRILTLEMEPELGLVAADPALLDVVVVNVLENALRYAPEGAITIRARRAGDRVRLDIDDEGPGIPVEDRERMFAEFVSGGRARDTAGTGIGLSIARAFLAAQGGTIAIDERPGGGARVTITLESITADGLGAP